MANTQVSPGVLVQERDLTNSIRGAVDNIGAIVGTFSQGPVEEIVDISSERQLLEIFGEPNDENFEYWFSAAQFLQYGGSLKVVRADNASLKNAIDAATFTETSFSSIDTTLTVKSGTGFDVNDLLLIDDELLLVTAVAQEDITVTRAAYSTSAASHGAGAAITLIEPILADVTTIAAGSNLGISDTTVTCTAASNLNISVNGYLRIEEEFVQVTAIAGEDLTITRGVLGSTAAAHTAGVDIVRVTATTNKTEINEETATGIVAPLIKNGDTYEATTETAANNWKWAARSPGKYGNSLRVLITDAGPDQVLTLQDPGTGSDEGEYVFTAGNPVTYSDANVYGKVYSYSVRYTLNPGATLKGEFNAGKFFKITNGSKAIQGTCVAYDAYSRVLEVEYQSPENFATTDIAEVGDVVLEFPDLSGGSATGIEGVIAKVDRKLAVFLDEGSKSFVPNFTLYDASGTGLATDQETTIASVEQEYLSRLYGWGQKWSSIAPRPGTTSYADSRGGFRDEMHVLVLDGDGGISGVPGTVLEKFLNVSKARDAKTPQGANLYYKDVIKASSKYLYWGSHEALQMVDIDGSATGDVGSSASGTKFDLFKSTSVLKTKDDPTGSNLLAKAMVNTKGTATIKYALRGGVDGYSAERDKLFDSYDLFSDNETEDIDYIIMGPAMSNDDDSVAKAQKMIDLAEQRLDCMAFVSPPRDCVIGLPNSGEIVNKTVEFFDKLSSSSYVVFDNNYKYVYDKYNDKYRYLPMNADIAGLTLETAVQAEPWFSPAGFTRGQIRNAVKLAYSPLKEERDRLYTSRINPVVAFPGEGIVLYGDKTGLATPSAFDRINVRRLFLVIEKAIGDSARSQLFEINDEFTRQGFKDVVNPYLRGVRSRRGIEDYLVVCDSTNNPDDAIDRGEFFAEIFVKPTRSINFITLRFTATRTGANFAEIVG